MRAKDKEKKVTESRFSRGKRKKKPPIKRIHIFSEGEKTEPSYFKAKKSEIIKNDITNKNKVIIRDRKKDSGRQGMAIIEYVSGVVIEEGINLDIDDVWVVYDRDKGRENDDNDVDFRASIEKGEKLGFKIAYSNDSFELWYLLHFDYMDNDLFRDDIIKKVKENFRKNYNIEYNKTDFEYYSYIKDKEYFAIKNAERLLKKHKDFDELETESPSTTVHLLVKELNDLRNK